jgi:hypothetical protein
MLAALIPAFSPGLVITDATQELLTLEGDIGGSMIPRSSRSGTRITCFHAYYGAGLGRGSALQISSLVWQDGWPRVGTLP